MIANAALDLPDIQPPRPCAPLVKWVGGKGQLLPQIRRHLPKTFGRYIEPFAGGAALFFHLARPGSILSDVNPDLIHAYQTVARDPERVIRRLRYMQRRHHQSDLMPEDRTWPPPSFYYQTRHAWNADRRQRLGLPMREDGVGWENYPTDRSHQRWSDVERASAFLYLNRTCFNGLWRVNATGDMNSPAGRYTNPAICDPERVRACAAVLKLSVVNALPWHLAIASAQPGDLVYMDPPYVPLSRTANFTSYASGGFDLDQQEKLADAAWRMAKQGVMVILSNSCTRMVREMYADEAFTLHKVYATRSVNSNASKRGRVGEYLITAGIP